MNANAVDLCDNCSEVHDKRALAKVVHLTSVHSYWDPRILEKECKALQRAGYEVLLIGVAAEDNSIAPASVDGVRLKIFPKKTSRLSRLFGTTWKVYREALRQDAELYHFHDPELIPFALLLRLQGKRVIYDIHEDLPRTIQYKTYIPRPIQRPLIWTVEHLEEAFARFFSGLVAATPMIADRFRAQNRNTIALMNFPQLEELPEGGNTPWQSRELAVAYIGSITRVRGVAEAVRAVGLLDAASQVRLKLAGWFDHDGFEAELRDMTSWSRVDWLGRLDPKRVPALLRKVRVGLVTLHPQPNFITALPVKLFEYMAAGVPVIISDFPLWRNIVESTGCGLVVDPYDVEAIARAIEYLFTHPAEAEQMGLRGQMAAHKTYNWGTEERKLLTLYQSLLSAQ